MDTLPAATVDSSSATTEQARLLRLARDGDPAAFRQLVVIHQARVFSTALRLAGSRADAEELAQDVFVQLHAAAGRINDTVHLERWLLRAVYHRSIDRLRQRGRQGRSVPLELLEEGPEGQAPESGTDPLAVSRLGRFLLQLQPEARAVLLLRFQDDLDPPDIAAVLDMPVNTVKSHLRRSLQWLRIQCAGDTNGS